MWNTTDNDFGSSSLITVDAFKCIDFTDLVVDDDIALEGSQAFTIVIGNSMAMVNIIDDYYNLINKFNYNISNTI